ncbi:hypothetical protein V6N12_000935 [Hibiscus sabdariffa]|uniref:WW domain-containing protein n=1 Tax=Hibiscus sabdariffa TaxID=183260 RepID=A0ABR2AJJ5_9ROSI
MIEEFAADGKPIYYFRDPITGHCPWDEDCSCEICKDLNFYEEMAGNHHEAYKPHKKRSKKKSVHSELYKRCKEGDPYVGPLALPPPAPQKLKPESFVQPCYKRIQKWVKKNPQPNPEPEPKQYPLPLILMFQPTSSSYDKDFPPLEEFTEKEFKHAPKIPTPLLGGKTSAAESTLNWQTENAIAQNKVLSRIDSQVTHMGTRLTQVEIKVDSNTKIANELMVLLHKRLQQLEKQTTPPGVDLFYHLEMKQKEIQTLKEQIKMLEAGQAPQPMNEEELFQTIRRGPSPQTQSSLFSSFHEEKLWSNEYSKDCCCYHEQEEEEKISSSSSDYESSECSHTTVEDMIMATNQPEVKTEDSKVDPMDTATPSTATTPPTIGAKYNFTIDDSPMENDVINGLKDSRNFTHGWRHKSLPEKVTMKS